MTKLINLKNIDLNFHLKHPGRGNEPGDPNAIFHLNGVYHLHYILRHKWNGIKHNPPRKNFPFSHSHSFIHCTSKDMINWKWEETKLQPSFTKHGMFSGTGFITLDNKPAIVYHGENSNKNFFILSKNNNLSKWDKPYALKNSHTKKKFWDPDCFIINKTYYSISGGINPKLFKSKDLKKWKYLGNFMQYNLDTVIKGEDISCPNFFKLKNKWVLLCVSHSHGCRYYVGNWDKKNEHFIPERHERMNWPNNSDTKYGLENRDFFAPETLKTNNGRRIMWSWIRIQNIKNLNILSLPREITISRKGKLLFRPLEELEELRNNKRTLKNLKIKQSSYNFGNFVKNNIALIQDKSFEMKISLRKNEIKNKRFGFELFSQEDNKGFPIIFQPESKTIIVGGTEAPFSIEDIRNQKFLEVVVFVDKYLIEVFINNVQSVVGSFLNFKIKNYISVYSFGSPLFIDSINIWNLKPANYGYKKAKKNKIWEIKEKI